MKIDKVKYREDENKIYITSTKRIGCFNKQYVSERVFVKSQLEEDEIIRLRDLASNL